MMMSEFIERTGFEPTADEYAKIEEAYSTTTSIINSMKHWTDKLPEDVYSRLCNCRSRRSERYEKVENACSELEDAISSIEAAIE